ncbi:MAG: glycosyltransferase family 2 protein, partial [Muribaculaceae bacterium]|nr:glycosyltransferase family 2 protein [Muribaculaceae bacterium]
ANGDDCVYSYYETISGENSRNGRIVATKKRVGYNDILKSNHIPFLTAIIKRSVVGNTRFKDITQEDFCFWLDILKKGVTAHNQCVVTALHRVSKGSRSSNKFKMARCYWHVIRHHQRTGLALSCRCMVTYAVEGLRKYMI